MGEGKRGSCQLTIDRGVKRDACPNMGTRPKERRGADPTWPKERDAYEKRLVLRCLNGWGEREQQGSRGALGERAKTKTFSTCTFCPAARHCDRRVALMIGLLILPSFLPCSPSTGCMHTHENSRIEQGAPVLCHLPTLLSHLASIHATPSLFFSTSSQPLSNTEQKTPMSPAQSL